LVDREGIRAEYARARATFHALLESASEEALDRPSNGTRWTNRQLLYHMMFGYMVVRTLLPLVKIVNRLPNAAVRVMAAVLNAVAAPFHIINYWGSVGGSRVYRSATRMGPRFDSIIASLERRLAAEPEANLERSSTFPTRWDPFFTDRMTVEDLYRYPTQHFDFHARQLTLSRS
jgi:hypothetical protein